MNILTYMGQILQAKPTDCEFITDEDGSYTQSFVLACSEADDLPQNFIFAEYPDVFECIATEKNLDPSEWSPEGGDKYYSPRRYKHGVYPVWARINRLGWIVEFYSPYDGVDIHYSPKYDKFFVFTERGTYSAIKPYEPVAGAIRKIYGKENP